MAWSAAIAGSLTIAVTATLLASHEACLPWRPVYVGAPGSAVALGPANDTPSGARGGYISRATWATGPWPFTVDEGLVACAHNDLAQVHTFTSNGVTYALNYAAQDTGRYQPLDPIWRHDQRSPYVRVNLAGVIDYARLLCAPV